MSYSMRSGETKYVKRFIGSLVWFAERVASYESCEIVAGLGGYTHTL
jgi:hypothetical protein